MKEICWESPGKKFPYFKNKACQKKQFFLPLEFVAMLESAAAISKQQGPSLRTSANTLRAAEPKHGKSGFVMMLLSCSVIRA